MIKLKSLITESKPNINTLKVALLRIYKNHMGSTKGVSLMKPAPHEDDIAMKMAFPSDRSQVFTAADYKNWKLFEKNVDKVLSKYKYQYFFGQGVLNIYKDN